MYAWLVYLHLVGLVVFLAAHGASMFASFRIRVERDPRVVAALLATSQEATRVMYIGLLLLGVGGLGAAGSGGLLLARWVVASYIVLVLVLVGMYAIASPYYVSLRQLVGDGRGPVDDRALGRALDSRRPEALMAIGLVGLLVLVWLMVLKPG
jgi:hypothetical protein